MTPAIPLLESLEYYEHKLVECLNELKRLSRELDGIDLSTTDGDCLLHNVVMVKNALQGFQFNLEIHIRNKGETPSTYAAAKVFTTTMAQERSLSKGVK